MLKKLQVQKNFNELLKFKIIKLCEKRKQELFTKIVTFYNREKKKSFVK